MHDVLAADGRIGVSKYNGNLDVVLQRPDRRPTNLLPPRGSTVP